MKRALAYKRKKKFIVHAQAQTTDGVWIIAAPCLGLSIACPDTELDRIVRAGLAGSRTGVPHPRSWTGLLDPLLTVAEVRSWSTFVTGASCVELEEEAGSITLIPTNNLGSDGGFAADTAGKRIVDAGSADIAKEVRRMLDRSDIGHRD